MRMQGEQGLARGPVGVVHEVGPFKAACQSGDRFLVALQALPIGAAQILGTAGEHALAALYSRKFDTAIIGKRFLRWIENMNEMAAHALSRDALEGARPALRAVRENR